MGPLASEFGRGLLLLLSSSITASLVSKAIRIIPAYALYRHCLVATQSTRVMLRRLCHVHWQSTGGSFLLQFSGYEHSPAEPATHRGPSGRPAQQRSRGPTTPQRLTCHLQDAVSGHVIEGVVRAQLGVRASRGHHRGCRRGPSCGTQGSGFLLISLQLCGRRQG